MKGDQLIGTYGSQRAGAALCSPYMPHMDDTQLSYSPEQILPNWYSHYGQYLFKKKGLDIPRPIMFKKVPCWSGSLNPLGEGHDQEGKIWVCDFNLMYAHVDIKSLREPTDTEYEKYYKKVIVNGEFTIRTLARHGTAKVCRNGHDYIERTQCTKTP